MECVTTIVLFDHSTGHWSSTSNLLDPVHAAITIFIITSLILTWRQNKVRQLLLIGLGSYIVMRVWSGLFFIREMLAFQKIPLDSSPSQELNSESRKMDLLDMV